MAFAGVGLVPAVESHAQHATTSNLRSKKTRIAGLNEGNIAQDDSKDQRVVYTDGACRSNGKRDAIAGIGVWWGHGSKR